MAEFKEVRAEIGSLLDSDAALTALDVHVYASRQRPGKFNKEICVFSGGNAPNRYASLGNETGGPVYDCVILWLIKFSEGELAEAEDVSDDIENAIYRILLKENYDHALWRKIVFPSKSIRPVAPGGVNNAHFGRISVRFHTYD